MNSQIKRIEETVNQLKEAQAGADREALSKQDLGAPELVLFLLTMELDACHTVSSKKVEPANPVVLNFLHMSGAGLGPRTCPDALGSPTQCQARSQSGILSSLS